MSLSNYKKRPGRRPLQLDVKVKVERVKQIARECRVRKRLRYQYLEDLVRYKEQAIFKLRQEVESFRKKCTDMDSGFLPDRVYKSLAKYGTGRPSTATAPIIGRNTNCDVNSTPSKMVQHSPDKAAGKGNCVMPVKKSEKTSTLLALLTRPKLSESNSFDFFSLPGNGTSNAGKKSAMLPFLGEFMNSGSHSNKSACPTVERRPSEQASAGLSTESGELMSAVQTYKSSHLNDIGLQENSASFPVNSTSELQVCSQSALNANQCQYLQKEEDENFDDLSDVITDLEKLECIFDIPMFNLHYGDGNNGSAEQKTNNEIETSAQSNTLGEIKDTSNAFQTTVKASETISSFHEKIFNSKTSLTQNCQPVESDSSQCHSGNILDFSIRPNIDITDNATGTSMESDHFTHSSQVPPLIPEKFRYEQGCILNHILNTETPENKPDNILNKILNSETTEKEKGCGGILASISNGHGNENFDTEIDIDAFINYLINEDTS